MPQLASNPTEREVQQFVKTLVADIKAGKYANDLSKMAYVENQLLLIQNSFLKSSQDDGIMPQGNLRDLIG